MPRKSKTPSGKIRFPPKSDDPTQRDRSDVERRKNNLQSNDRAAQELERIAERFKIGLQRMEWERRVGAPLPIDLKTLDQSNYLSRSAEYRAFWDVYGEALHDTQDIEGMVVAREIAFRCFPELVGHPPPEALVEAGNEDFLTPPVLVIRGFDTETHPDFDPENESVPQSYTAGGTFLYKQDVTKERYIRVQLDLSEDTENLLERTKAVINEAKRLVGRDKSRRRGLPRDFWKIVDTANKIGTSSAAAVMETIDPMERKPYGSAGELSSELWVLAQRKREKERKRIEHAIKLAQKMRLLSPDSTEET